MINTWILFPILIGFFVTIIALPYWIRKAKQIGLVWEDMNKPGGKKNVVGSGGIVPVLGAIIGIFLYIAIQTFIFNSSDGVQTSILAIVSSLLLVAGVGLIDDLFGWRKGGLSIRSRLIFVTFAAVPLMVINSGESMVLGVNLGLLYPLLVIPLGVLGATTTFNFIEGYNGLGAKQGILILGGLAIATFFTGNSWLSVISLIMISSLTAFYLLNRNPARIFPGDVLTYSIGALIAGIAILGNIEKIALFFFIPYIIEAILKIRGGVKNIHNFGIPNKDGSLELRYKKVYSLTHLALFALRKIKKKVYENDVVNFINVFQILVILLGLLLFL